VLCPDTHEEEGAALAERLRTAIGQPRVPAPAGDLVNVTISIGCAGLTGDTPDLETLLKLSDRALYAAKDGGRDRVFKACDLEKESGIRPPFKPE
jgi:diguanylate cyclase (GGDEF)-like protein